MAFEGGVLAVERQAEYLSGTGWSVVACGKWTATQTARHLYAVTKWYHGWLDRALQGDTSPPFDGAEMDLRNDEDVEALDELSGPIAIGRFAESARSYFSRVDKHWDVPFAYPFGLVTAGLHAGVAAAEWHLHAWDLSTATGHRHRPDDPKDLFLAVGACIAARESNVKRLGLNAAIPIAARRSPWETMLRKSGRLP